MYQENINEIKKVSAEAKSAIARKSAQTLPVNPSERGYSAEEIKRRFYQPITDSVNSALAEIDRVVDEVNETNSQLKGNLDAFVKKSLIKEPYKVDLTAKWQLNESSQMYEVSIPASEHGIDKYDEIGVDMYLLDGQGKYINVNQFEILENATVRFFHEANGEGYANIYIKREGYIESVDVVDVNNVIGLSKVAVTGDYDDLKNKPNLDIMKDNEEMISKMISGAQPVNQSENSKMAESAKYASTSGASDFSTNSQNATKAEQDQYGVNISEYYCKRNGSYPELRSGNSNLADKALSDEEGTNIKSNYAKQDGTYPELTAGKATNAEKAANADVASKAVSDNNGANISETYATKNGNYQNMTVGKSSSADKTKYVQFVTVAPTSAPPEGCLTIYVGSSIPATKYDRVLYLISY